jgi:hypothetical protein
MVTGAECISDYAIARYDVLRLIAAEWIGHSVAAEWIGLVPLASSTSRNEVGTVGV